MNCKDFDLLASANIDNMLSNEERMEFENHLEICETCNIAYKNLETIISSASEIEEVELPSKFSSELRSRLEKETKVNKTFSSKMKTWTSIAAGLLIILASISLLSNYLELKKKPNLISEIENSSNYEGNDTYGITMDKNQESLDAESIDEDEANLKESYTSNQEQKKEINMASMTKRSIDEEVAIAPDEEVPPQSNNKLKSNLLKISISALLLAILVFINKTKTKRGYFKHIK